MQIIPERFEIHDCGRLSTIKRKTSEPKHRIDERAFIYLSIINGCVWSLYCKDDDDGFMTYQVEGNQTLFVWNQEKMVREFVEKNGILDARIDFIPLVGFIETILPKLIASSINLCAQSIATHQPYHIISSDLLKEYFNVIDLAFR